MGKHNRSHKHRSRQQWRHDHDDDHQMGEPFVPGEQSHTNNLNHDHRWNSQFGVPKFNKWRNKARGSNMPPDQFHGHSNADNTHRRRGGRARDHYNPYHRRSSTPFDPFLPSAYAADPFSELETDPDLDLDEAATNHKQHQHHHKHNPSSPEPSSAFLRRILARQAAYSADESRMCPDCRTIRKLNMRLRDDLLAGFEATMRAVMAWAEAVGVGFGVGEDEMDWQPEPLIRVLLLREESSDGRGSSDGSTSPSTSGSSGLRAAGGDGVHGRLGAVYGHVDASPERRPMYGMATGFGTGVGSSRVTTWTGPPGDGFAAYPADSGEYEDPYTYNLDPGYAGPPSDDNTIYYRHRGGSTSSGSVGFAQYADDELGRSRAPSRTAGRLAATDEMASPTKYVTRY